MPDLTWVQVSDNSSWHIMAETTTLPNDQQMVRTRCGLIRNWDGTSLDRLPGGSETSCENCLKLFARGEDAISQAGADEPAEEAPAEEAKPKRRGKKVTASA